MAARAQTAGGQNPEFVLRDYEGMNNVAAREDINDNEFYWCENAIPVAPGALYPVPGPTVARVTIAGETGGPSYTINFNVAGFDFCFAVWANSGNGWIVNLLTFAATKIFNSTLTSGQTSAAQYNNQGLLIADPTGYFDYNVTTAATVTSQNNALTNATLVFSNSIAGGTQLKNVNVVPAGPGTGAIVQTTWTVNSVTINAAGTGYVVGDSLILTDGSPTAAANIIVATIGGGGTVTSVTLASGGSYPGPVNGAGLTAIGPVGATVSGGSGTGVTFTTKITTLGINILNRGSGYSHGATLPNYSDQITTNVAQNQFTFQSSGVISATTIAVYAGRVWLGNGRVVFFTDINSYTSFGGAGGSFTINDSYLHNVVTALFAANNYLYIFGDTSIDALSNVTISSGVTSFSRINLTASIGTSAPTSVFAYYRAIIFYHSSGFYLLSGATPEKISEKISGIVQTIILAPASVFNVYGCQVQVQGELCAALMFRFTDNISQIGVQRSLIALFFRGKWWCATPGGFNTQAVFSIPILGVSTMFIWAGTSLYQSFNVGRPLSAWTIKTKLWDGSAALKEKQAINTAIAGSFPSTGATGVTITVDTEKGSSSAIATALAPSIGYDLLVQAGNEGGSQYLGLTLAGSTGMTQINLAGLRGKADRDMLL